MSTENTQSMADFEGQLDTASPWKLVKEYEAKGTKLNLTIEGVVKAGVVVKVEGIRGFVPASRLSLSYVENLETFLNKEMEFIVIEADQASNKLVLSAREGLKATQAQERESLMANVVVGSITTGTVESLQAYGAFVRLENGLSGLVHISQISHSRVKAASDVLKAGQEVDVKITAIKDGKISLSMKALVENPNGDEQDSYEPVDLPVVEALNTNMGDLFKNIQL